MFNTRKIAKTFNVLGMIKGSIEPGYLFFCLFLFVFSDYKQMVAHFKNKDRYVIFGNHRDSWSFGGFDPSGGTAIMLEMTRALSKLHKKYGWQPKRSILFQRFGFNYF